MPYANPPLLPPPIAPYPTIPYVGCHSLQRGQHYISWSEWLSQRVFFFFFFLYKYNCCKFLWLPYYRYDNCTPNLRELRKFYECLLQGHYYAIYSGISGVCVCACFLNKHMYAPHNHHNSNIIWYYIESRSNCNIW